MKKTMKKNEVKKSAVKNTILNGLTKDLRKSAMALLKAAGTEMKDQALEALQEIYGECAMRVNEMKALIEIRRKVAMMTDSQKETLRNILSEKEAE